MDQEASTRMEECGHLRCWHGNKRYQAVRARVAFEWRRRRRVAGSRVAAGKVSDDGRYLNAKRNSCRLMSECKLSAKEHVRV